MGLPLYIAPVESDIHNKTSSKAQAYARTAIRRYARHRSNEATRESRRRALAAAAVYQATTDPWLLRSRSTSDEPGAAAPSTSNPAAAAAAAAGSSGLPQPTEPGRARDTLRDFIGSRMGLDDRTTSLFGERWAGLHPHMNSGPARDEFDDTQNALLEAALAPDTWGMSILDSNATRRRAILQADPEPSRRRLPPSPPPPPLRRLHSREFMRGAPPPPIPRRSTAGSGIRARRSAYAARPSLPHEPTERPQEGRFDGLGDRNRSLSPEADDVWDTLLSTLTPDPQPPSVGSSFASASASAAASQTAGSQSVAAGSSSTSLTGPDPDPVEDDSNMEPPCESGCEHSDTEGDNDDDDDDDDDDLEQNTLTRFPPGLRHSRSYADVAARATGAAHNSSSSNSGGGGGGDEALEFLGGMGGMQRIVRNLARREDIPDEWWAEAGLSRSLSREGSA